MIVSRKSGLVCLLLWFLLGLCIGGNVEILPGLTAANHAASTIISHISRGEAEGESLYADKTSHANDRTQGFHSAPSYDRFIKDDEDAPADFSIGHLWVDCYFEARKSRRALSNFPSQAVSTGPSLDLASESCLDVQVGPEAGRIARFGHSNGVEFQSLVEIRPRKSLVDSGNEIGRGAIRLLDTIDDRALELGYYRYGAGLFTSSLFEFFTNGVSIRGFKDETSFLAIRDFRDLNDIRLRHDGQQGIIETTGPTSGGLRIGGHGYNIFHTDFGNVMIMTNDGNVGIGKSPEFGAGSGVLGIANATDIPVENPTEGGILYVEDGALKYRGPSGTITTIANP